MVLIQHSLNFITELDETHPTSIQLLNLPKEMQIEMLESALKDLIVPFIKPEIDRINEGNTFAVLKVAE